MTIKAQGRATSGETVTVLCKIPMGMQLKLYEERTVTEVTLGGSRSVKQFFETGAPPIVIHGPAHGQNEGPRHVTVAGYAVTSGVPKDVWDAWMAQAGRYHPAVQKRLLMALPTRAMAGDAAREHAKTVSGLERLDPNNLPTVDRNFKVQMADEQLPGNIPQTGAGGDDPGAPDDEDF